MAASTVQCQQYCTFNPTLKRWNKSNDSEVHGHPYYLVSVILDHAWLTTVYGKRSFKSMCGLWG